VDRGLARLRSDLGEVKPELVARSQEPVTRLMRDLVVTAADAGRIHVSDAEEATYMIVALKTTFITSQTLGNDFGVRVPSVQALTSFCLAGLGASMDDGWFDTINARLRLPSRRISVDKSTRSKRKAKTAEAKASASS
jgi:hypothetical protein